MSLSRFGDEARKHPKMVKAGNDAAAFWRWAIEYSNEVGSNGFVDESILHTIPPVPISKVRAKKLAEALVDAWVKPGGKGLFERCEGGYMIHDFGEFRPTRARAEGRSAEDRIQPEQRKRIIERDGLTCGICGRDVPINEVDIDHIVPYSKGGKTVDENLRVTHYSCNRARLSQIRAEVGRMGGLKSAAIRRGEAQPKGFETEAKTQDTEANSEAKVGSHAEPNQANLRTPAHIRACAPSASESDQISEARRDPDLTCDRATPEAERVALEDLAIPATMEPAYDLGRRLWGEEWQKAKGKPYGFLGPMNRAEGESLRWLGRLGRDRGGEDAERWIRHWLREYFAMAGYEAREGHTLGLLKSAVNKIPDPPSKSPRKHQEAPPLACDQPRNPHAAERAAALMASLPGANLRTEAPDARDRRERDRHLKLARKASLDAQIPNKGAA